jgi:hypothetical protein
MSGLKENRVYKKPSIDPGPVITAPILVRINSRNDSLTKPLFRPLMTSWKGYIASANRAPRNICIRGASLTDSDSDGFITKSNIGSLLKYLKYRLTSMKNMPNAK